MCNECVTKRQSSGAGTDDLKKKKKSSVSGCTMCTAVKAYQLMMPQARVAANKKSCRKKKRNDKKPQGEKKSVKAF